MTAEGSRTARPRDATSDRLQSRLTGPRGAFDPRVSAVRAGIVDIALAAKISASRYVAPAPMICTAASAPVRAFPADGGVAVSEILHGEGFDLFDEVNGWAWGRTVHDGYLGWLRAVCLVPPVTVRTLKVTARSGPVFADADIKSAVVTALPFGSRIADDTGTAFVRVEAGAHMGFVHRRHLGAATENAGSPLEAARLFTGAPYVWGGRSPGGVDCSGLVQAALNACDIACPRDSDQQRDGLGQAIVFDQRAAGDLVFFPGHVGLLATRDQLFHANAHWMTTLEEPLDDVIARLRDAGAAEPVSAVRRLPR